MSNPLCFETRDALMDAAAERIAESLENALKTRGIACAALSGGRTPAPAYERLARYDLDWPRISFALVDERFVPPDHAASNEGLLRRALAPALANGAEIAPMFTPDLSLHEAADVANARYAHLVFDIALMGMGTDGHTASWFKGSQGWDEATSADTPRTVVAVRAPDAAGAPERLTLTRAALGRAARVELLITGEEKYRLIGGAHMSTSLAPAGLLFHRPVRSLQVLWAA
ncbi:MAG: 6-phosphogluconolactonase [Hyphomonadaceae bacterium]